MTFFSEIYNLFSKGRKGIEYLIVDAGGGYFQNVKKLEEFSNGKIVLRGKKGVVAVEGEGLTLQKYGYGDVMIGGNILKVERFPQRKGGDGG